MCLRLSAHRLVPARFLCCLILTLDWTPALAGPAAPTNELWFCPAFQVMQSYTDDPQPIDLSALFHADAPWPVTASHLHVFKIGAFFIKMASDDELTLIFENLRDRHIKLALEFEVLTQQNPAGGHLEAFMPEPETAQTTIARVKACGGRIDYLAMDEPCWYGSIYSGPGAAHWPLARIAANAAETVQMFQAAFPDIQIGDIEPVAETPGHNLAAEYSTWLDAMEKALGSHLAFFHVDIVWEKPWRRPFDAIAAMVRARNLSLGIIYNASYDDSSNDHWLAAAEQHYEDLENNGGLVPDQAIFQSWSAMPTRLLPETAPNTYTGLIFRYLCERVNLTAVLTDGKVHCSLSNAEGALREAPISLEALQTPDPTGLLNDVWKQVQTGKTDDFGEIDFQVPPEAASGTPCRVVFPGDAENRGARATLPK